MCQKIKRGFFLRNLCLIEEKNQVLTDPHIREYLSLSFFYSSVSEYLRCEQIFCEFGALEKTFRNTKGGGFINH